MNTVTRPSFTQNVSTAPVGTKTTTDNIDPRLSQLVEQRRQRPEIGAIWERQAKSNNMNYLKIRLKFSRAKLQELLANTPETTNPDEIPITEFVAFPNTRQENNTKRPSFRVYEAQD